MKLLDDLRLQSKTSLTILGFALILVFGIVDYVTGPEVSFSLFYLLPIAAVT